MIPFTHMMHRFRRASLLLLLATLALPPVAYAEAPFEVQQAAVWVHCGDRQGSGVVIHPTEGYVLTNAHVLLDLETHEPGDCQVGFITQSSNFEPDIFYWADWRAYVFDEEENYDFAVLDIGDPVGQKQISPFPYLKTYEFSEVGDPITILGYPSKNNGNLLETNGTINDLEFGIIKTDAEITPGTSGGAGINDNAYLVGLATRILVREVNGVEEVVDYELVDIRSVLTWIDTQGKNKHDEFLIHADPDRYHLPETLITQGELDCTSLARSVHDPAVYCMRDDGTRSVFPNKDVFFSWYSDFSDVETLADPQLANYQLVSNITMKPGSLVKIQTDPKVYIVSDITGTLRWIQNEQNAIDLYGEGWAGFVTDVPATFFINYHVGAPAN